MTPQEFKQSLWDCYDHLEKISLESTRTTQEMVQGSRVNDYIEISLDGIGRAIYLINHEYFLEEVEDLQPENQSQLEENQP